MPEPAPRPVTLKVSGSLLDDAGVHALARAIEALPPDWRAVLVHGGGPQIDEALATLDEPIRRHRGLRVTSRAQAGVVEATLDRVGSTLAHRLDAEGVQAEHVNSLQAALVAKTKRLDDGTDLGRVGTPVRVHTSALPEPPTVPVVTPMGTDGTGPLNVNADEAAAAIAAALGSPVLVFATSVPGVLDADGTPIEHLAPAQAKALVAEGTAEGGMAPKLDAGLTALADGVERVHVAPLDPSILQEAVAPGPAPGTRLSARPEAIA